MFCQRVPFLRGRSRHPKFFWGGGYPLDSFTLARVWFRCKFLNEIGVSLRRIQYYLDWICNGNCYEWMSGKKKIFCCMYKDNRSSMWKLFFFSSLVFGMVNAQKTERHVEKRYWKFLFASMNLRRIPIFDFIYILTFNVHLLLLLNIK